MFDDPNGSNFLFLFCFGQSIHFISIQTNNDTIEMEMEMNA